MESGYSEAVKFFVGLLAIINPFGVLPIFISFTQNLSSGSRRHINLVTHFAVMIILLVSLFWGEDILRWFGISISSFRIAGGTLIFIIAYNMIQGSLKLDRRNLQKEGDSSFAVVPMALPLMAGPGAISSTIVYASEFHDSSHMITLVLAIVLFTITSFLIFSMASIIYRILHQMGVSIVTKIMGMIMMALGVEIFAAGLRGEFPALGG
ncbi:MAG: YchE family NAAT transporter [Succinivibrionaceae bacterium]